MFLLIWGLDREHTKAAMLKVPAQLGLVTFPLHISMLHVALINAQARYSFSGLISLLTHVGLCFLK